MRLSQSNNNNKTPHKVSANLKIMLFTLVSGGGEQIKVYDMTRNVMWLEPGD